MHEMPVRARVLKPWRDGNGYAVVNICKDGKRFAVNVHRLVAEAFHGEQPGTMDVNHKDGDKANNAAGNLEWCTRKQNMLHALRTGLLRAPRKVLAIPKRGGEPRLFDSIEVAIRELGLTPRNGNIRSAVLNQIPSAYGYVWRYAD